MTTSTHPFRATHLARYDSPSERCTAGEAERRGRQCWHSIITCPIAPSRLPPRSAPMSRDPGNPSLGEAQEPTSCRRGRPGARPSATRFHLPAARKTPRHNGRSCSDLAEREVTLTAADSAPAIALRTSCAYLKQPRCAITPTRFSRRHRSGAEACLSHREVHRRGREVDREVANPAQERRSVRRGHPAVRMSRADSYTSATETQSRGGRRTSQRPNAHLSTSRSSRSGRTCRCVSTFS